MCALKRIHEPQKVVRNSLYPLLELEVDISIYHSLMSLIIINGQQPYLSITIAKCQTFYSQIRRNAMFCWCLHIDRHTVLNTCISDHKFYL